MKTQTIGATLREIIGGTPAEVLTKALLAAVAMLWNNLADIAPALFLYLCMVLVDALMGKAIAQRAGKKVDYTYLLMGPGKKLALTTAMLFCTSALDSFIQSKVPEDAAWAEWVPVQPSFVTVAIFILLTAVFDVLRKWEAITGKKITPWLRVRNINDPNETRDEPPMGQA